MYCPDNVCNIIDQENLHLESCFQFFVHWIGKLVTMLIFAYISMYAICLLLVTSLCFHNIKYTVNLQTSVVIWSANGFRRTSFLDLICCTDWLWQPFPSTPLALLFFLKNITPQNSSLLLFKLHFTKKIAEWVQPYVGFNELNLFI